MNNVNLYNNMTLKLRSEVRMIPDVKYSTVRNP